MDLQKNNDMRKNLKTQTVLFFEVIIIVIGVLSVLYYIPPVDETPSLSSTRHGAPSLLVAGQYKEGNIYSPEIFGEKLYFGGMFDVKDFPYDSIYSIDVRDFNSNKFTTIKKLIQSKGNHVNDPSITDNAMYMTFAPDPSGKVATDIDFIASQYIAISRTEDFITWSEPKKIIEKAWLPSAVKSNNKLYIYYTFADGVTNQLMRADMLGDMVISLNKVKISPNPVNVDVQYYNGTYYLLGDYIHKKVYSIGLWTSTDGINFEQYPYNPLIMPTKDNIIARTPNFIKDGNLLKIYYAQQKKDWWTNNIYYKEMVI